MALYEHIYLVRQDVTAQQVEALTEQYTGIIEANGGKITKSEYWGVKTLAFRIKKNRKAHFTLFNIDGPSKAITEMERVMAISEDVIRSLTVRVEAHEDGPSAMLQTRERDDDRGDRGFGCDGDAAARTGCRFGSAASSCSGPCVSEKLGATCR